MRAIELDQIATIGNAVGRIKVVWMKRTEKQGVNHILVGISVGTF